MVIMLGRSDMLLGGNWPFKKIWIENDRMTLLTRSKRNGKSFLGPFVPHIVGFVRKECLRTHLRTHISSLRFR